jgi:hypothetical protein
MNLRDSIEDERVLAEKATDEKQKRIHTSKGKDNGFLFYPSIEQTKGCIICDATLSSFCFRRICDLLSQIQCSHLRLLRVSLKIVQVMRSFLYLTVFHFSIWHSHQNIREGTHCGRLARPQATRACGCE